MGYLLRSARGRKQGLAIFIRTRAFLIGSSPKSQIRSCKPGIGRRHCVILSRKKQLFLQDLESGHPTQVNGLTVSPGSRLRLKIGDRVAMGPMEFIVEQRKKKKAVVPVAAPFEAPPVPMGRVVTAKPTQPVAVPITDALTAPLAFPLSAPDRDFGAPRPPNSIVPLVMLGALAIIGLGAGVGLSRAFLGDDKDDDERRVERKEEKPPEIVPQRAKQEPVKENLQGRETRIERKTDEPKKEIKIEKPVEVKKPVDPPKEEPQKPVEPPKEEPKKPVDPMKEEPKKPVVPPTNTVAYASHVLPLLKESCVSCHSGTKKKGGLDLSTIEAMLKGGETGPAIVAGNPDKSPLFLRVDDDSMPPAGKTLSAAQKKMLQEWIQGAKNGDFAK